jgi:chromosome segregation ATPase
MKCPYCRREIQKNELPLDILNKMKDIEKLEKDIKIYNGDLYHIDNQIDYAEKTIDSWIKHLEKCNNSKKDFLEKKKEVEKKLEDLRNK